MKFYILLAIACFLAYVAGYATAELPECGLTTTAPGEFCYRVQDGEYDDD